LTRASINLRKSLSKVMDDRVKPGHDGFPFINAARFIRAAFLWCQPLPEF